MVSSRWQKRNTSIFNVGVAVSMITSVLLSVLLAPLWRGRQIEIVDGVTFLLGAGLTVILQNRYPNSLIRILKFDYQAVELSSRKMFTDKHIRFNVKMGEDSHQYTFPGTSLIMSVQPYLSLNAVFDGKMYAQPATQVTLGELNAKNKALAGMLAASIDEMVNQ